MVANVNHILIELIRCAAPPSTQLSVPPPPHLVTAECHVHLNPIKHFIPLYSFFLAQVFAHFSSLCFITSTKTTKTATEYTNECALNFSSLRAMQLRPLNVFSLFHRLFFLTIQNQKYLVANGIEPRTTCITHKCSATELRQPACIVKKKKKACERERIHLMSKGRLRKNL